MAPCHSIHNDRFGAHLVGVFIRLIKWKSNIPIGCMGLVCFPTLTIKINHSCRYIYKSPMDPMGYTTTVNGGIQKQPTGNHHYLKPYWPSPGPWWSWWSWPGSGNLKGVELIVFAKSVTLFFCKTLRYIDMQLPFFREFELILFDINMYICCESCCAYLYSYLYYTYLYTCNIYNIVVYINIVG